MVKPAKSARGFNQNDSEAARARIEREAERDALIPLTVFKGSAKLKQDRRAGEGSYARKQRQG